MEKRMKNLPKTLRLLYEPESLPFAESLVVCFFKQRLKKQRKKF
jgi:hypothetical protein